MSPLIRVASWFLSVPLWACPGLVSVFVFDSVFDNNNLCSFHTIFVYYGIVLVLFVVLLEYGFGFRVWVCLDSGFGFEFKVR
jgi:hypothetical protein